MISGNWYHNVGLSLGFLSKLDCVKRHWTNVIDKPRGSWDFMGNFYSSITLSSSAGSQGSRGGRGSESSNQSTLQTGYKLTVCLSTFDFLWEEEVANWLTCSLNCFVEIALMREVTFKEKFVPQDKLVVDNKERWHAWSKALKGLMVMLHCWCFKFCSTPCTKW